MVFMHNIFQTTVVCGIDLLLKDHLPKVFPRLVYNAEYNPLWTVDEFNKYIETIKSLSRSGMYIVVSVPHNAIIRKRLEVEDVKYTNITPDDTPEMLDFYMDRYKKYHQLTDSDVNTKFTKNHFKTIFGSLKNDTGSVSNIVLDKSTFDGWDQWLTILK